MGFEPTVSRLKVECSNQLSHGYILNFKGDRWDLTPQLSEPQSEVLPIELQPQLGRQESDLPDLAPKTSASPLGYAPKFQDGLKIAFLIPN